MYMSSGSHFFHFFEDLEKIHTAMQYNFVNYKCIGRLMDFFGNSFFSSNECDQNQIPSGRFMITIYFLHIFVKKVCMTF